MQGEGKSAPDAQLPHNTLCRQTLASMCCRAAPWLERNSWKTIFIRTGWVQPLPIIGDIEGCFSGHSIAS
jgi:hypothetical protein